jgi:hypothetical protein
MLSLEGSKTITVDGITIFPDHKDPSQFWYLPGPVNLARRSQDGRASFTCIKYKPAVVQAGVKGGGFLTFEVNLRLDPKLEKKILSKLSSISKGKPKLAAVPFDSGTVQCIALNLQGGGGTSADPARPGTFNAVEKILGATVPSLHGDNSAAFSLTLDQEGAIILEKAFKEGTTPVGVIYNLTFTGIRPSLDVKITADFKRIYNHFSASLTGQYYFIQVGIEAGLEKLVQDGAIKIEVTNFSSESDRKEKETWALNFFKDNLLQKWFEPTLTPAQLAGGAVQTSNPPPTGSGGGNPPPTGGSGGTPPPTGGAGGSAPTGGSGGTPPPTGGSGGTPPPTGGSGNPPPPTGGSGGTPPPTGGSGNTPPPTGGSGGTPPPTGGSGNTPPPTGGSGGTPPPTGGSGNTPPPTGSSGTAGNPAISFKLKFIQQEELKTLTLQYSSAEAVQRTYAPQGFFGLLVADLEKNKHFVEVDLDNEFFRVFTVTMDAPIDFSRIGLTSAQLAIDYGNPSDAANNKHGDFIFDAQSRESKQFQVFMNVKRDTQYTYSVQYHFDPASGWEGQKFSYELPPQKTVDRTLFVNPFEDLGFLEVRVFPNQIDRGIIQSTDVYLRYQDTRGWKKEKIFAVTPDSEPQIWKLRLTDPTVRSYTYRFEHHLKDGSIRKTEPVTTQASALAVNDPFEGALEILFFPAFDPSTTRTVFVDVRYNDPNNKYKREERLKIAGDAVDEVPLRIALMDPSKTKFEYRFTFIGTNGKTRRGAYVATEETLISVLEE